MKKRKTWVAWLVIILSIYFIGGCSDNTGKTRGIETESRSTAAKGDIYDSGDTVKSGSTGFTSPAPGDTIRNREDFPVSLQIGNYDQDYRYWVAIATVTVDGSSWDEVKKWYSAPEGEKNAAREEIKRLLTQWRVDQFWPKFCITDSPCVGRVYDGGTNPMKGIEPQPMILLILKVEDRIQENFARWLREGPQNGYPGFSSSELADGIEVLARCEIFFP